ncbi:sigma-70 [Coccidioides immitis RMSCC 2394]|uniref:Sigma-70 n=1 Tax=Coccidioides immitis RMSCC 2394 TaxID=404692 RepID=A0A0J6YLD3_COCIT|nr:sigma-70 [Coccidioides immitis RMSCC 2394]
MTNEDHAAASHESQQNTLYCFMDGINPDSTAVKRHAMNNHIHRKRAGELKSQGGHESNHKAPKRRKRRIGSQKRTQKPTLPKRTRKSTSSDSQKQNPQDTTKPGAARRLESIDKDEPSVHDTDGVTRFEELDSTETIHQKSRTSPRGYILINPAPQSHQDTGDESQWNLIVHSSQGSINYSRNSDFSLKTSPFPRSSSSPSPSQQCLLGATWRDPFNSLPMKLSEREEQLFHFYVNVMPACSYGFNVLPRHAHNWYNDVFVPEAMKEAICFQNTILVHAANTQAWVSGLDETAESIAHRDKGIKALLRHRINRPDDFSDPVISATLSAAAVDDFDPRAERKEPSWWHMRAAMEMIRRRGGPTAFRHNRRMAMLINWSDYIFSGFSTNTRVSSFYFGPALLNSTSLSNSGFSATRSTDIPNRQSSSPPPPSFNPISEIEAQCEVFLDFLDRSERLAIHSRFSLSAAATPRRSIAFGPGSLLVKILSSPIGLRYSIPGERKQIISRLAALMMINAALWDCRLLPGRSDRFLRGLSMKLVEKGVDLNESVEALLQILLASDDTFGFAELQREEEEEERNDSNVILDGETGRNVTIREIKSSIDPYERPWFVGRMLKIAKRLDLTSWSTLNLMLLSFLTLEVSGPKVAPWEPSLKREILSAPMTMYIMPILRT